MIDLQPITVTRSEGKVRIVILRVPVVLDLTCDEADELAAALARRSAELSEVTNNRMENPK